MRQRRRRRCSHSEPPPGPVTSLRLPSTLSSRSPSAKEAPLRTARNQTMRSSSKETTSATGPTTSSSMSPPASSPTTSSKEASRAFSRTCSESRSRTRSMLRNIPPKRPRAWRTPRMPSSLLLFLVLLCVPLAAAVKCYCTDDHCVPYGACEGNACLVGILKESNQVIRTCGNQKVGCFRDVDDKWADLCVCEDEFCNTFSFLRQNTQKEKPHTFPQPVPASSDHDHRSDRDNGNGYFKSRPGDFHDDEDDHLVFHRMDRPDDGPQHNPDAPLQTSFVTILLVVVPLTVGALTVVIVAFNYYCHLC